MDGKKKIGPRGRAPPKKKGYQAHPRGKGREPLKGTLEIKGEVLREEEGRG